ncbi:MAG: methyltransferase [Chitinophagaceae bacterium]|nr:methyltransferase [Chitinophagaceae bacterium]
MPNPYFKFKQFTILHDQCAMKVCTDACIFGAYFSTRISPGSRVLDIGSGSGLLTLLLAQKAEAQFHAIEKDIPSFEQMQYNVEQSLWKNKIILHPGDVTHYTFNAPNDFIICNPPFYENDLKSDDEKKNLAKHDTGLTLEKLIQVIDENLAETGRFGLLLPYRRTGELEQLASDQGFYLLEKLLIRQTPDHDFFRSILYFTRQKKDTEQTGELIIKQKDGNYTPDFNALMKDYYLHL